MHIVFFSVLPMLACCACVLFDVNSQHCHHHHHHQLLNDDHKSHHYCHCDNDHHQYGRHQDSSRSLLSLPLTSSMPASVAKSAFTPPLLTNSMLSPDSPRSPLISSPHASPAPSRSLILRRRTIASSNSTEAEGADATEDQNESLVRSSLLSLRSSASLTPEQVCG